MLLLKHGADINLVDWVRGWYKSDKKLNSFLQARGADAFHVDSLYETLTSGYPTALDAARAGKPIDDIYILLSTAMKYDPAQEKDTTWPPFPMSYGRSGALWHLSNYTAPLAITISACHYCLEAIINNQKRIRRAAAILQRRPTFPAKVISIELFRGYLWPLLGSVRRQLSVLRSGSNQIRVLISAC